MERRCGSRPHSHSLAMSEVEMAFTLIRISPLSSGKVVIRVGSRRPLIWQILCVLLCNGRTRRLMNIRTRSSGWIFPAFTRPVMKAVMSASS